MIPRQCVPVLCEQIEVGYVDSEFYGTAVVADQIG